MDWPNTPETLRKHNETRTTLESIWKKKEGKPKERGAGVSRKKCSIVKEHDGKSRLKLKIELDEISVFCVPVAKKRIKWDKVSVLKRKAEAW